MLALALPPILSGLGADSGFVAYASEWRRNGALNPILETVFRLPLSLFTTDTANTAALLARGFAGMVVAAVALIVAMQPIRHPKELIERITWIVLALFLMSPAQYPWYMAWIIPFMALHRPIAGILIAAILLPIYYVSFYFRAHNFEWVFNDIVVFVMWVPIWFFLLMELRRPKAIAWLNFDRPSD